MKGYYKTTIRVAGIMPRDCIRIGDTLFRIREYKQLDLTRSTQFVLVDVNDSTQGPVILSLLNSSLITVHTPKVK
jgi:hypothetical protein